MYRVSRYGVIVFEPCDNLVTRLGVRLGLGQEYELAAVAGTGCAYGGQRNTPIPNYVYRWTPREIEKTIYSYAPFGRHQFRYFYRLRVPWYRSQMLSNRLLDWVFRLFTPLGNLVTAVYPRAANNFAFVVLKPNLPDGLHPWLEDHDGAVELNADVHVGRKGGRRKRPPAASQCRSQGIAKPQAAGFPIRANPPPLNPEP